MLSSGDHRTINIKNARNHGHSFFCDPPSHQTTHHQTLVLDRQIRCQRVLGSGNYWTINTNMAENIKSLPPNHRIRTSSRITSPNPVLPTITDSTVLPNPTITATDDPFDRQFVSPHYILAKPLIPNPHRRISLLAFNIAKKEHRSTSISVST